MKVMFAITKGEVGGAQEHVRILARGLIARGHQVGLVVQPGSALAKSVESMGATTFPWTSIRADASPLANLSARRELQRAVVSFGPRVLHLHSSVAGAVGCRILQPPKGVTVFTCHHAPFGEKRSWKHRVLGRPIAELTLPRMDGIISVGIRDLPVIRRIAPKVPVNLIRNAVVLEGPPASVGHMRRSALWVARLAGPKNPLLAVAAWERLMRSFPDAQLRFCGTGPLEGALKERVARSPACHNIFVEGFVGDLRPFVAAASIFLLVSNVEGGISMATLEAMGNGLVPVVTDAGDASLIADNECGVVARADDPASVAEAVATVLCDSGRFATLRANAISFARDRWDTDDMVDATVAFYDSVTNRTGAATTP